MDGELPTRVFDFTTQQNDEILVRTAISGVSMEGAERLACRSLPRGFRSLSPEAADRWNRELG